MFEKYCRREYRYDIQGLRALGALIIMVFHIWVNKVSGGVDVFFVVSGFLMSSILLKNYFQNDVINPLPFWGGIIKRISPSAYVVLSTTLIFSYFLSSPARITSIINEVITSALHLENIQLIRKSVDYLQSEEVPSPVQQFWALSIQMQFYFILPFILLPLASLSKANKTSKPMFIGIFLSIIASFIYANYAVKINPSASYFNPLARVWEFLLGTLSFLIITNIKDIKYRELLGFLGVVLIIGGAIFIPREANFSGVVSLVPVFGAILIIISGANNKSSVIKKILSNKILVFLGGISFTIYLWHWPILILYKEYFGVSSVSILHGLLIMAGAIALAYITTKTIENPFKAIPRKKVVINFGIGISFALPLIIACILLKYKITYDVNRYLENRNHSEVFTGHRIIKESKHTYFDREYLISVKQILPKSYSTGCHQAVTNKEVKSCTFGDLESNKVLVLIGGSHAAQWLPALDIIAKNNNLKLINITKSSCPFGALPTSDSSCLDWNNQAINDIIHINPIAVITNSTRTDSEKLEWIPESYISNWKELNKHGIEVIGIRDNPRFKFDVADCVFSPRKNKISDECKVEREKVFRKENPALQYENLIRNIDMTDYLCTSNECLTSFSNILMYRDAHHINLDYVLFVRKGLEDQLMKVLEN